MQCIDGVLSVVHSLASQPAFLRLTDFSKLEMSCFGNQCSKSVSAVTLLSSVIDMLKRPALF